MGHIPLPDDQAPWALDTPGRAAVEQHMKRVLRRRLDAVRYFEITYEKSPLWSHPEFDALDYGLELDLDGEAWSVIWETRGGLEGLALYAGPLIPDRLYADANIHSEDVSQGRGWKESVGATIEAVETNWLDGELLWRDGEHSRRSDAVCVQAIALGFSSNQTTVLALGEVGAKDGHSLVPAADNVVVIFGTKKARSLGAWRN